MHLYNWKSTDKIFSAAYDTYCEFEYDEKTNQMNAVDKTRECFSASEKKEEESEKKEIVLSATVSCLIEPIESINLGFNSENLPKEVWNHAPKWNNGKCTICNYEFDPKVMENNKSLFDATFFMN